MKLRSAGLPPDVWLSSSGKRLVGAVLELVLAVLTLFVGWLVWSLVAWGRGQTPAKQVLGMTVVRYGTANAAGRGRMLVRELPAKWLVLVPRLSSWRFRRRNSVSPWERAARWVWCS